MAFSLPVSDGQDIPIRPSKIIALGLNYLEHIRESKSVNVQNFNGEVPTEPVLFSKTPNVLIGPGQAIILPRLLKQYDFDDCRVDYEAELAIIIKDRVKDLAEDEVFNHILGFTCFNDVSQRNFQRSDKGGWFRGKTL